MGKKTRGAWSSSDTRQVLFHAVMDRLSQDPDRRHLDISEILQSAARFWAIEYSLHGSREFTRGAITSQWRSMDDFIDAAIVDALGEDGAVTRPFYRELEKDLAAASYYSSLNARRSEVTLAIGSFIYTTVMHEGDQDQRWDLRMQLFTRSKSDDRVRELFERSESRRRQILAKYYVRAVKLAHWKIKPRDLAQAHLMVIDGALLQLGMNSTLSRHHVASLAQDSIAEQCAGLTAEDVQHEEPAAKANHRTRTRVHLKGSVSKHELSVADFEVEDGGVNVREDQLLPPEYEPVDSFDDPFRGPSA